MDRRRFLRATAAGFLGAPLVAAAQEPRLHPIGFLHPSSASSPVDSGYAKVFQQELSALGY